VNPSQSWLAVCVLGHPGLGSVPPGQPSGDILTLSIFILPKVESTVVAKSFENDTNINFHKVCCLSLYDDTLHILQNVMKSDQMNCN
jgi:hypothetical protein